MFIRSDASRSAALLTFVRTLLVALVACAATPAAARADALTVAWDANPEPELRGYLVYVGTQPGVAAETYDVGNVTRFTFPKAVPGVTYYFTVAAYGTAGVTSARSNEITAAVPAAPVPPTPTPTPPTPTPVSLLPRTGWRVHFVDSEDKLTAGYLASNVLDGNPQTMWHTQWKPTATPLPHEVQIDMAATYSVSGVRYLPRQDGGRYATHGRIGRYEVSVSTDGVTWGTPVATGTFANSAAEKEVRFTATTARYVRLRALSDASGKGYTTMAELNVLGTAAPTAPAVPTTGLALHLKLDEPSGTVAADASGNGRSGLLLNGATWTAGKTTGGVKLDGVDDSVFVEAFETGPVMTVALWVHIDSGRTNIQTLLSTRAVSGGGQRGFHFWVNGFNTSDKRLVFDTGNGTAGLALQTAGNAIGYAGWHHVAAVINKTTGTGTFYVDGVQVAATGGVRTDFPTNLPLYVGRTGDGWSLGGQVDDVRVYTRALSAAEIAQLAR